MKNAGKSIVWMRVEMRSIREVKLASLPSLTTFFILVTWCFSISIRWDDFDQHTWVAGLAATYHVLWTVKALSASPLDAHWLLPTVTLAPEPGNPISWGLTVPTPQGSFIYTSFPPLGFLIPYVLDQVGEMTFKKLALFNSVLGLIAAIGTGLLARAVFQAHADRHDNLMEHRATGWIVYAAIASVYLFLRESLVSHGVVYWPHSLSQITLVAGAWITFRILRGQHSMADLVALCLVSFIYPSLEWTGFVFNVGLVIAFLFFPCLAGKSGRWAALVVVLASLAAGLVILAHFVMALGVQDTLSSFGTSALSRSALSHTAGKSSPPKLAVGYFVSFGALLPLGLLAFFQALRTGSLQANRPLAVLLFVTAFPIMENVIVMQHAAAFSFDRLKMALPLLLICVFAAKSLPRPGIAAVLAVYLVVSSNLQIFAHDKLYYADFRHVIFANSKLINNVREDPLFECSLLAASGSVRGYLNLSFGRDIFELSSVEDMISYVSRFDDEACGIVMIHMRDVLVRDFPRMGRVEIFDASGQLLRTYSRTTPGGQFS